MTTIMNFRQVRKKIKTIGNVKQITKAMQMVSSVKMKKAQDQAVEGRLYRETLDDIMNKVIGKTDVSETGFMKVDTEKATKSLYVVITSNKGLCGSFNFNVFKLMLKTVDFKTDDFITIGKKGADFLVKMRGNILADFSATVPFMQSVSPVFSLIKEKYNTGEYKAVYVVYNQFISTLKQQPMATQMLPLENKKETAPIEEKKEEKKIAAHYVIEPSVSEVFESLLLDFLQDKLRGAILDSEAAEHSARMMAMKNATDSAGELVYSLTLLRNKLRQASITNELLEITTATISSEGSN